MEPQKQEPQQPEKPEGQAERLADKLLHGAYQVSRYVEIVLAILIIVVVAVLVVRMIADLFAGGFAALEVQNFTAFLANVLATHSDKSHSKPNKNRRPPASRRGRRFFRMQMRF